MIHGVHLCGGRNYLRGGSHPKHHLLGDVWFLRHLRGGAIQSITCSVMFGFCVTCVVAHGGEMSVTCVVRTLSPAWWQEEMIAWCHVTCVVTWTTYMRSPAWWLYPSLRHLRGGDGFLRHLRGGAGLRSVYHLRGEDSVTRVVAEGCIWFCVTCVVTQATCEPTCEVIDSFIYIDTFIIHVLFG